MSTENNPINPFTFITEYDGDWKDMMDEEIEGIFGTVEELRTR